MVAILVSTPATATATSTFIRPENADCVSASTLASGTTQLYPSEYQLEGDSTINGSDYTKVSTDAGFTVTYYSTYKVVNNTEAGEVYVLCQCGSTCPSASLFPEGTKFFLIPLVAVSVTQTVPFAFLNMLGVEDRVQSVSALTVAPCGQKLVACNRTAPDAFSGQLDNATYLATYVEPFTDGLLLSSASNISTGFSFSAATAPGSLNRAEWIKFLGAFFNKEKEASDIYDAIEASYNSTRDAAAKAAAASNSKKPVVAWISAFEFAGESNYQISFAPYKAALVADAGGQMLNQTAVTSIPDVAYPDSFGSPNAVFGWNTTNYNVTFPTQQAAQAAFVQALQQADVLVDETYTMNPLAYNYTTFLEGFNISAAQAQTIPALSGPTPRVVRVDGLISVDGSLDWFEGAIARPDKVLADLYRVLYPSLSQNASDFIWMRSINQSPVVLTPAECEALPSCSVTPATICPFVSACPSGPPALLVSEAKGVCKYAECYGASSPTPAPAASGAASAGPAAALLGLAAAVAVLMH